MEDSIYLNIFTLKLSRCNQDQARHSGLFYSCITPKDGTLMSNTMNYLIYVWSMNGTVEFDDMVGDFNQNEERNKCSVDTQTEHL